MTIAGAAGIMVYISMTQLVPLARTYGSSRVGLASFLAGSVTALVGLALVSG